MSETLKAAATRCSDSHSQALCFGQCTQHADMAGVAYVHPPPCNSTQPGNVLEITSSLWVCCPIYTWVIALCPWGTCGTLMPQTPPQEQCEVGLTLLHDPCLALLLRVLCSLLTDFSWEWSLFQASLLKKQPKLEEFDTEYPRSGESGAAALDMIWCQLG